MKKIILISMILCTTLYAKWDDFENPNGEPFLLTVTLQKGGKPGFSLPLAKFVTISYAPGRKGYLLTNMRVWDDDEWEWASVDCYGDCNDGQVNDDAVVIREEDIIDLSEGTYSIDLHIPIYKLWKK